ncbi:MAG: multicopper oxidase domain-containing protein [Acidimicrobiia bacterium]
MESSERSAVGLLALAISVLALILAGIGVAVANNDSGGSGGSGSSGSASAAPPSEITLKEFSIGGTMQVSTGGKLRVTNAGSMEHNLAIKGTSLTTPNLAPSGEAALLDVSSLIPGAYDVYCTIPGHEASGMKAQLVVGPAPDSSATATTLNDGSQPVLDPEKMDLLMEQVALSFPAKTKGIGGDDAPLEPKILADGTKEFTLTAEIVDWEVEPGKIVKAWTYNGVVPGPTIRADVGDKIRVVLINKLPESTSLHLHGIRVPNKFDGVDPFTQPAQKPGTSFVYEWTALEPAVGMYHSHHDAQIQIPNGMAGAFIIGDYTKMIPSSLGKVNITQEVTMVLNDAGTIGLSLNGKSFPATKPYTLKVGESMLVHYYNEGLTGHPMHLHQPKGYVVAKDGVPLEVAQPQDTIFITPGERYSVLYTATDPGVWAWHCHILNHAETPEGMRYMVTAMIVTQ